MGKEMPQPTRSRNNELRHRLIRSLAPAIQNVPREQGRRAPCAISTVVPKAQLNPLVDHALEFSIGNYRDANPLFLVLRSCLMND